MKYAKTTIPRFSELLASADPVPGGGGASALAGALGAALTRMVANLTVGKKKYAAVEADVQRVAARAEILQKKLLSLIDEDAEAFLPLAEAYRLPKETEPQRAERAHIMESALYGASLAPLAIMETCCEAIGLLAELAEKGSRLALSDVGVGAALCKAALMGAGLNVFINTGLMADRQRAGELNARANDMLDVYCARADEIYDDVRLNLR